jgi:alkaline phosphatase
VKYHLPCGLLLFFSVILFLLCACSFSPPTSSTPNIILFIGDGMQLEHEIAASRYLYGIDNGLAWHSFPDQLYVATWDVTTYNAYAASLGKAPYSERSFDPVIGYDPSPTSGGEAPYPIYLFGSASYFLLAATDSASSATAYATGVKTDNGNIAWERGDPWCGKLKSIVQDLGRYRNASIGVITTVPFNHATPAAFASHNTSRTNYEEIADEMISTTRPEVIAGGGHPNWCTTYFSAASLASLRSNTDYRLVERVAGQSGAARLVDAALNLDPGKRLFGLFGSSNGDFDAPVPHDAPGFPDFDVVDENPSLADMVEVALTVLGGNPDGFFLMSEQGDIDHANHANDYAMMIGTMWGLEEAVKAAMEFIDRPDDQLDWGNTLLIVTADHANSLMRLSDTKVLGMGDLPTQLGGASWTYPDGEVTYGSMGHTNELVTLYATGSNAALFEQYAGARYPGTRIIDNTEVNAVMRKAAGLR